MKRFQKVLNDEAAYVELLHLAVALLEACEEV